MQQLNLTVEILGPDSATATALPGPVLPLND